MNVAYLNSIKVNPQNQISLYNPSFLYGINCFEGIRGYYNDKLGKIHLFDFDEHIKRLYDSASLLSLSDPISSNDLTSLVNDIINKESLAENIYIRITFFISDDTNWADQHNTSFIISVRSIESNLVNAIPIRLGISSFRRLPTQCMPPHVKAGANYLNSRYALLDSHQKNNEGALFLTVDGYISESTGSCIFFVQDNCLVTPSKDCDILFSITRERIIKLCKENDIPTIEAKIESDELSKFKAAFLVGTMIEIKPIKSIDNYTYDVTNDLLKEISKLLHSYVHS